MSNTNEFGGVIYVDERSNFPPEEWERFRRVSQPFGWPDRILNDILRTLWPQQRIEELAYAGTPLMSLLVTPTVHDYLLKNL